MRIEFYFSFRSTYSFLAIHRLERVLPELGVEIDWFPVFPPPGGPEPLITADERRFRYSRADFVRICEAYGLEIQPPHGIDTEWMPSHAAFYYAQEQGKRLEYVKAAFACRFQRGRDLGEDEVLVGIAEEIGLDPVVLLAAAHDAKRHEEVTLGMIHFVEQGFFGVPGFVVGEQKFWGNDRFDWAIREIFQLQGRAVPDLAANPFAPPVEI
ncbi:MAG: DsbA family protein [Deltaproteobacteria bacterium]